MGWHNTGDHCWADSSLRVRQGPLPPGLKAPFRPRLQGQGCTALVVFSVSPVHSFSFTASGYLGAEGVRDALSGHLLQANERKGRCTPLSLSQRPEFFSVPRCMLLLQLVCNMLFHLQGWNYSADLISVAFLGNAKS